MVEVASDSVWFSKVIGLHLYVFMWVWIISGIRARIMFLEFFEETAAISRAFSMAEDEVHYIETPYSSN